MIIERSGPCNDAVEIVMCDVIGQSHWVRILPREALHFVAHLGLFREIADRSLDRDALTRLYASL